ncbi:MAG TPA: hybrid sensor histidine kinase/response regulator, partial [Bacteroidales bacterium]|nr:hybrid sensor histidine kinase/response regulator [Bacteroidales bacterium]
MEIDEQNIFDHRILVVDDNPKNIQIVASVLASAGFKTGFALAGKDALARLASEKYSLVLLDVMMPEMDGFEVCIKMKDNAQFSDIPVIFLTARNDSDSIVRGFEAGAVDFVSKPFNKHELIARVKNHLQLKTSRDTVIKQAEELKIINLTKDKFFAIIAHDLRNPFNALLGLSEILCNDYDSLSDEERKEFILNMREASENTFDLLNQLLEWARVQQRKIEFFPAIHTLNQVILKNMALIWPQIQKKQIEVVNNLTQPILIYADMNMLLTIVRNILSNAVKFTPPGGRITVSAEKTEWKSADAVQLTIADTGVG